jgi:hypothetical protein
MLGPFEAYVGGWPGRAGPGPTPVVLLRHGSIGSPDLALAQPSSTVGATISAWFAHSQVSPISVAARALNAEDERNGFIDRLQLACIKTPY